ncbi:dihydrolipoamide acetyltransferase family protein [Actinomycetospora chibensis]|nr:dihydrolipoamide acetyltransferase family protein [Actinomycetospora chibensis]MDD7922234.1 dihydrolipoamide acetyltransferase family protein [Actinomycetospora chibensis]
MPSLGADMESGTLVEWTVSPGDRVHRGDLVAAVETEKSVIDVECFEDGVVERLLVPVGTTVPVGAPLALITPDGTGGPSPEAVPPETPAAATPAPPPPEVAHAPPTPAAPSPRATPLVRRLAERLGLDLAAVPGSGPGGAVTRADVRAAVAPPRPLPSPPSPSPARLRITPYARRLAVERGASPQCLTPGGDGVIRARDIPPAPEPTPAAAPPPESPPESPPEPPPATAPTGATAGAGASERMRAAIAARMTRSMREIPHYHVDAVLEIGAVLERLREVNRRAPVPDRMVPAVLLLHAAARAARQVPELNGHWVDGAFVPATSVALGVVVSLRGGGLLVPTIPAADELPLPELMASLRGVAGRARSGRLRSSDTAPASITVTDLGETGAHSVHGLIFPPEVALVGFGAVVRRPWADGDLLGTRPTVVATLTGDHRATDGIVGGRFLHVIDTVLHDPEEWP